MFLKTVIHDVPDELIAFYLINALMPDKTDWEDSKAWDPRRKRVQLCLNQAQALGWRITPRIQVIVSDLADDHLNEILLAQMKLVAQVMPKRPRCRLATGEILPLPVEPRPDCWRFRFDVEESARETEEVIFVYSNSAQRIRVDAIEAGGKWFRDYVPSETAPMADDLLEPVFGLKVVPFIPMELAATEASQAFGIACVNFIDAPEARTKIFLPPKQAVIEENVLAPRNAPPEIKATYETPLGYKVEELAFKTSDPYEWQGLALERWAAAGYRGMVEAVTGAGKTKLCFQAIRNLSAAYPEEDIQVTIVVPTEALMGQWREELLTNSFFEIREQEVACFGGGAKDPRSKVNLIIVNSARTELPRVTAEYLDGRRHFLIVDEAHRTTSDANKKIYQCHRDFTLGVSATLPWTNAQMGDEQKAEVTEEFKTLQDGLGPLLSVYRYAHALEKGTISKFQLNFLYCDLMPAERSEYDYLSEAARRATDEEGPNGKKFKTWLYLRRGWVLWRAVQRMSCALRLIETLLANGEKIILFAKETASVNALFNLLVARGHPCGLYHSQLPDHIRENYLQAFRDDRVKVMLSCQALLEGLSVPSATVGVAMAFDKSSIKVAQSLGRVLRVQPGVPLKNYYCVLVKGTTDEILEQRFISAVKDVHGNPLVPVRRMDVSGRLRELGDAADLMAEGGIIKVSVDDTQKRIKVEEVVVQHPEWALVKPERRQRRKAAAKRHAAAEWNWKVDWQQIADEWGIEDE